MQVRLFPSGADQKRCRTTPTQAATVQLRHSVRKEAVLKGYFGTCLAQICREASVAVKTHS